MANQGILQAQLKVKNSMNLENGFIDNPLLKSVEGEINLTDENSFKGFAGNTAIEHLDPIKSSSQNAVDLTNSLNNLSNLKYAKLEGNFDSSTEGKFSGNTAMQKLDLSQDITIKPNDLAENESLRELPKLDFSNPDLTDIITNDTELKPTTIDLSNEINTNKLGIHGDSTYQLGNLEFVKVNPEAPFDNQITPQIDVSYTSLDKNGLVNLFNTLPYNVGYTVVGSPTITDGVASGFSNSNYLSLNTVFPTLDNIEGQVKFTPGGQTSQGMIFQARTMFAITDFGGSIASYNWNTLATNNIVPSANYEIGATYIVKFKSSPSQNAERVNVTFSYSKNGGTFSEPVTYEFLSSQTTTLTFGTAYNNKSQVFNGSIDLNETYIKINSIVSTGPVGYTVVGSPTISNGVVSGFSTNDYVKTSQVFSSIDTFEIYLRVLNPSTFNSRGVCGFSTYSGNFGFYQNPDGTFAFRLAYKDENQQAQFVAITSNRSVVTSSYSRLYGKIDRINGTFTMTQMLDDGTVQYTNTKSIPEGSTLIYGSMYEFGLNQYGVYEGGIDLNNTYIKINGKLWFGHESKQVTWFNGKSAMTKTCSIIGCSGTSNLTNDDKAIATNKGWTLKTTL